MGIYLGIESLSLADLRKRAVDFLAKFPARSTIPIDIDGIVDIELGISVFPIPGLHRLCDTDAFISSGCTRITVDEFVYFHRENRFRFSLAHEIGHLVLHGDALSVCRIDDIDEYLRFRAAIDVTEFSVMERQANAFAGLVLVPGPALWNRFQEAKRKAALAGVSLDKHYTAGMDYVSDNLARQFRVSRQVMDIRLKEDGFRPMAYDWP